MANPIARAWAQVKTALVMRWSGYGAGWRSFSLGSTAYDYSSRVDGRTNAAAVACVRWLQRTFPEAPTQVMVRKSGGLEPDDTHPLAMLLSHPNGAYSGLHLWSATVADLTYTGNAYWLKLRNSAGGVVELWWVPSTMLEPKWPESGSVFIDHYDYTIDGKVTAVAPADVVHFRDGFDPNNIRKGLSPFAALAREIATDDEAANWTAGLLRNSATPGVLIAPDGDAAPDDAELLEVKNRFIQQFSGDHRGAPLVMRSATKITPLSWSPDNMNLKDIRRIPEERISAVIGVPAMVAGLGAGLDRSTFANFAEAREAAYESCLIPLQRLLAAEINNQLTPDFGDPARLYVHFDLSHVRVLQQDENDLHNRVREDVRAGVLTINEGRQMLGIEPLENSDRLLIPNVVTAMLPTDMGATPEPVAPPQPLALPAPKAHQHGEEKALGRPLPAATEADWTVGPELLDDVEQFIRETAGANGVALLNADTWNA